MSVRQCPVCRQPLRGTEFQYGPFCSERCQQIDLGRWLDERYVVPIERPDEDEDAPEEL